MEDPKNEYNVRARVWKEWETEAKWAFNRLYELFKRNEKDIVIGGAEPVLRFTAAMAAELVNNKRLLLEEFYFGPREYRADQLRKPAVRHEQRVNNSGNRPRQAKPTKTAQRAANSSTKRSQRARA